MFSAIDAARFDMRRLSVGLVLLSNPTAKIKERKEKEVLEKEKTKSKLRKEKDSAATMP